MNKNGESDKARTEKCGVECIPVPGQGNRYEFVRLLGKEQFGSLSLVRDTAVGILVTIRVLGDGVDCPQGLFDLVSQISHCHIATDMSLFRPSIRDRELGFTTCLVSRYVPGATLDEWREQFSDGKVPLDLAIEVARQIADAVDYAQRRDVVHADLKPSNVIVETRGSGLPWVFVRDYCAAAVRRQFEASQLVIVGTCGNKSYISPEEWEGNRSDAASNQFSLAVLFYELVTGMHPIVSARDSSDLHDMFRCVMQQESIIASALPKHVLMALKRALSRNATMRFATCGDFIEALKGNAVENTQKVPASFKVAIAAAIAAAFLAGGVCGWRTWRLRRAEEQSRTAARLEDERQASEKAKAERRAAEESARIMAETKAREEAERLAFEQKRRAEEAQCLAAEQKAESDRLALEKKQREEAESRRKFDEKRKAEEQRIRERTAADLERQMKELRSKRKVESAAAQVPVTGLSAKAKKFVGVWSCDCSVTYKNSFCSRSDVGLQPYLPASGRISLCCNEDGTVVISDSSGRSFGNSTGTWLYKHGMLIMNLRSDDGRSFRLSGTVNWRDSAFELHYDTGEYANMVRMGCEDKIVNLNAVNSSYVDGYLEVSISTKDSGFTMETAVCSPHVFFRN